MISTLLADEYCSAHWRVPRRAPRSEAFNREGAEGRGDRRASSGSLAQLIHFYIYKLIFQLQAIREVSAAVAILAIPRRSPWPLEMRRIAIVRAPEGILRVAQNPFFSMRLGRSPMCDQ
jgi:hypothetical protein